MWWTIIVVLLALGLHAVLNVNPLGRFVEVTLGIVVGVGALQVLLRWKFLPTPVPVVPDVAPHVLPVQAMLPGTAGLVTQGMIEAVRRARRASPGGL